MKLIINLLSSGVSYNVCRQNANRKKSEKTGNFRWIIIRGKEWEYERTPQNQSAEKKADGRGKTQTGGKTSKRGKEKKNCPGKKTEASDPAPQDAGRRNSAYPYYIGKKADGTVVHNCFDALADNYANARFDGNTTLSFTASSDRNVDVTWT